MKLWSRGLGRTEITMDFRYYKVIKDPDSDGVIVVGNMQDPVTWEFTMKMEPDDIAGVLKLLFNFSFLWFVLKNLITYPIYLLNRKKYVVEGEESMEDRVMASYAKMTTKKSRKKKRGRKQAPLSDVDQMETQAA